MTAAQLMMSQKEKDRIWQRVVQAKIRNQAEALKRIGVVGWAKLNALARSVLLADRNNREAVAASEYFRLRGIVRTNSSDEINPMPNPALNYGYAIVRAAMARALVKAGLLCVCGIHHCNRSNAFALADDMTRKSGISVLNRAAIRFGIISSKWVEVVELNARHEVQSSAIAPLTRFS